MKKYAFLLGFLIAVSRFLYKEDKEIQVTEREFHSEKLPEAFEGFRIVHVSDYHNGWFGWRARHLLDQVRGADGDVIMMTGDVIDRRTPNLGRSKSFIRKLTKIGPVYYVTGNHEAHYKKWKKLKKYIEKSDMMNLSDTSVQLVKDGQAMNVVGMPDPWFLGNEVYSDVNLRFDKLLRHRMENISDYFTILMSHRPELFLTYVKYDIDLVLSGHAHGGQIRLPFVGGLYSPHQGILPKYAEGMHKMYGTALSVSRGLGNSRFPFRVFNHPEIVVLTLRKK
ncbi:metallophosphoesterase [Salinicoccus kekensis]|uniref:Calcineurin-like phosphoesterase domain-containing protein n=1 Tax=Salinicoccus kekensis TaxID=714307 RepID=A0A285ULZ1_9STAP|nr:metallophosphoesterase [Salinicoccus kekensis]SOC42859.1 hypothetical protein SAMN05878391_1774 [Salinicoccus kekensis]